eukprot:762026-Hanusia_phi.AAC.6
MHNLKSLREILSENGMSSGLEASEMGNGALNASLVSTSTLSPMLLLQNSYLVSSDNNRQAATRPIDIQMDMLEKSLHGVDAAADILPHAAYIAGLAHNQLFMPSIPISSSRAMNLLYLSQVICLKGHPGQEHVDWIIPISIII